MGSLRGAQTGSFTVPAGEIVQVPSVGEFIRCLESSDKFVLSVDDDARMYFDAGIEYRLDGIQEFRKFSIVNNSGSALTVTMAWGFGEFRDGRLALNSTVNANITNAPDVTVLNPTDLSPVTSLLSNDQDKRSALTTLSGASSGSAKLSTNTVVSSGANVNGVIIRHACLCGDFGAQTGHIKIGSYYLFRGESMGAGTVGAMVFTAKDIFVPSGLAIELYSSSNGIRADIWFEVL